MSISRAARISLVFLGTVSVPACATYAMFPNSESRLAYAIIATFFSLMLMGALVRLRSWDFLLLVACSIFLSCVVYQTTLLSFGFMNVRVIWAFDLVELLLRTSMWIVPIAIGLILRRLTDAIDLLGN